MNRDRTPKIRNTVFVINLKQVSWCNVIVKHFHLNHWAKTSLYNIFKQAELAAFKYESGQIISCKWADVAAEKKEHIQINWNQFINCQELTFNYHLFAKAASAVIGDPRCTQSSYDTESCLRSLMTAHDLNFLHKLIMTAWTLWFPDTCASRHVRRHRVRTEGLMMTDDDKMIQLFVFSKTAGKAQTRKGWCTFNK